ncbi:MAG: hypothetical protein HC872_01000, partial [Gammaproteobacteria bacterium]|nr:hypothetical protein [Gammaproteobacteria bacterium]
MTLLAVDRSLLTLTAGRRTYEPNLWVPRYYRAGAGRITVSRQSLMAGALIGERAWGLLPLPRPPTFPHPESGEVPFLTGQWMGSG